MTVRVRTTWPLLPPPVAGGTDIIQPAKGRGEFFYLGQGALAGRLTRAIDIKDHPCVSCSIHQPPKNEVGYRRGTMIVSWPFFVTPFPNRAGELSPHSALRSLLVNWLKPEPDLRGNVSTSA